MAGHEEVMRLVAELQDKATAARICAINLDVGPSSRNEDGLSAAINVTPRSRSIANPTSCTMKSRAKRASQPCRQIRRAGAAESQAECFYLRPIER
jgi:hypothetical protein